jgi:hypothetical protein
MKTSRTSRSVGKKVEVTVDPNMRDYSNDPFFIKKRKSASEFLKKNGLPDSFKKK